MASHCMHCHKGRGTGHMVSHAKNRLKRFFLPNLQQLKVLQNGALVRVVLCTSCIKRLKKDGHLRNFFLKKYVAAEKVAEKPVPQAVKPEKTDKEELKKPRVTLDIASIVGLPAGEAGKKS